jgi:hypothetical protein
MRMPLPFGHKREPRPVPVSVRLSKRAAEQLKALASAHNLSQADVIEYLLAQESESAQSSSRLQAADSPVRPERGRK